MAAHIKPDKINLLGHFRLTILELWIFNSLAPGKFELNLNVIFKQIFVIDGEASFVKLPWYECHLTSLIISQNWFR